MIDNLNSKNKILFYLNGEKKIWQGVLSTSLLDVLRYEFKCTGVKCGCKEGECGACSVILDGILANSCMIAMGSIENSNIITIEGYKKTKGFEILNKAFSKFGAVQCGFCIPGMILAADCILRNNPNLTESEIRIGISGNLCRCTGYNSIVKAIIFAAKEGKEIWKH